MNLAELNLQGFSFFIREKALCLKVVSVHFFRFLYFTSEKAVVKERERRGLRDELRLALELRVLCNK